MDTIDRQAAIELTFEEPSYSDPLNILTEVRDKLKSLPTVKSKQVWIPCSEQLPFVECGLSDKVFATCGYMDVEDTSFRWVRELYFNGREWLYPSGVPYNQKVYAWMPLPEPWKGDTLE